jgi:hypothetical protein
LLPDDSDRKFFEVALRVGASLITGNARHYPDRELVVTPAEYMARNKK